MIVRDATTRYIKAHSAYVNAFDPTHEQMIELDAAATEYNKAVEAEATMSNINEDVPEAGCFDYGPDNAGCLWLGRLVWIGILLATLAMIAAAVWGLCLTAIALGRGEAWAEWFAAAVFLVAFMLSFREIKKQ